jgi:hypothetical protein
MAAAEEVAMRRFALAGALVLLALGFLAPLGFLRLALGLSSAEARVPAPKGKAAVSRPEVADCRLQLDGKFIARLMLMDGKDKVRELATPGRWVSLPAGKYRLDLVELNGGFSSYGSGEGLEWFQLAPGKTHRLNIGAPLTPKIEVSRSGRILELDYALLDAGGRRYSRSGRTDPPQFAVFKGDRKVGSGTFRYG